MQFRLINSPIELQSYRHGRRPWQKRTSRCEVETSEMRSSRCEVETFEMFSDSDTRSHCAPACRFFIVTLSPLQFNWFWSSFPWSLLFCSRNYCYLTTVHQCIHPSVYWSIGQSRYHESVHKISC